ncbi:MAG: cytochrome c oxidase assembly protein [Acidimicrobiia bacterium]|nr:cytochrome c oxidase assembly protein [Acidimicrobiia bacterium]
MPPPLTLERVLLDWSLEPVAAVIGILAAGLYLAGVRRLRRRGRCWPATRTASFLAGVGTILFASMSGIAAYEERAVLRPRGAAPPATGMAGPLLLALAAPITLALQAAHRPTQVFLLRILHTPVVRFVTHPAFVWLLFGGTLFVLYFTSLYELSLRNDVVHLWLHLHFVVSGALFFWVLVGLDPSGWPLPYWQRLLLVLAAVPFHVFLGVALLGSDQVVAADWYGSLGRTWGPSPLADQRTGAGLLWMIGDLLALVPAGILLAQWMRYDEREAERADRAADRLAVGAVEPDPHTRSGRAS